MSNYFQVGFSQGAPGREDLKTFLSETSRLLFDVVFSDVMMKDLFGKKEYIVDLARRSFEEDVVPAIREMVNSVDEVGEEILRLHGLLGLPAKFKLEALKFNAKRWRRYRGQLTVRKSFVALFQAVDVVLDSIIDALGTGLGGLVKEFKDMLMSCAFLRT